MIFAKKLTITQKDGTSKEYLNVTQMYTIGNNLTITGEMDEVFTTDRYRIELLHSMSVEF